MLLLSDSKKKSENFYHDSNNNISNDRNSSNRNSNNRNSNNRSTHNSSNRNSNNRNTNNNNRDTKKENLNLSMYLLDTLLHSLCFGFQLLFI